MTTGEVLNLIAIVIIPLVAVWLARHLQDRAEKRKDKMDAFLAILTFRYGWSPEGVKALNSLHFIFSDDDKVRSCWRNYYKELNVIDFNKIDLNRRNEALYSLLESMARNLGYKDPVTWEDIHSPYVPQGMIDAINNNTIINSSIANISQSLYSSMTEKKDRKEFII